MNKIPVESIAIGDVILPPARELQLWMRRDAAARGLAESALHLTVTAVYESASDKNGRWIVVRCARSSAWLAGRPDYGFSFKSRPMTSWPIIQRAAATVAA